MQVIVKHPRIIGGKLFAKSPIPQVIPKELVDHWFTKACLKSGDFKEFLEPVQAAKAAKAKADADLAAAEKKEAAEAEAKAKADAEAAEYAALEAAEAEEKSDAKGKSKKGK